MRRYEIAPHVADIRLRVEADSLEELFRASLEGISDILRPGSCKAAAEATVNDRVELSAPDTTSLLIDFLSEALALSYINRVIFCQAEFSQLREDALSATIMGTPVAELERDIKAVTYHEAEIRRNDRGNYETMIVMDV